MGRVRALRTTITGAALAAGLSLVTAPPQAAEAQDACPSGLVALTFDDGPGPETPELLDILASYDVPATFFVLGRNVDASPEITQRTAEEGHAVANHTYDHERLTEISDAEVLDTIDAADATLRRHGIEPTTLLRPPYGATDARVASLIEQAGYTQKTWDVDPEDWRSDRSAAQIRDHVLDNLFDGAVVLLHDWSTPETTADQLQAAGSDVGVRADASNTIAAVPDIIEGARGQGYCFGYLTDDGSIVAWADDDPPPEDPPEPITGDLPAVVGDRTWYLRDETSSGGATTSFTYGRAEDVGLFCDWNGDGQRTPVIVRGNDWHLRADMSGGRADLRFTFGRPGDHPVCGDWNGDGVETVGVTRHARWHLRNSNSGGPADLTFTYGREADVHIVGDWNGDGTTTVGMRRLGRWHLRDSNSGGRADHVFTYGTASDVPVIGDWGGTGSDRPGIVRGSGWYLRTELSGGPADEVFTFDVPEGTPRTWR